MSFWGALGSIAGAVVPGLGSYLGQQQANAANAKMAREQMAFQERMSSTSYQRGVEDMRKAGINPILAAGAGGASSPSGAMARMEDKIGPAVANTMAALQLKKQLAIMDAEVGVKKSQKDLNDAQTQLLTISPSTLGSWDDARIPYAVRQKQLENLRREIEMVLMRAGVPAAEIRGSKAGQIFEMLMRGIGVFSPLAKGRTVINRTENINW